MINFKKICQTSFQGTIKYIVMVHDMQMTVTFQCKLTTLGQYYLAFQGPKILNSIDDKARNIKSFNIFNNIIKRSIIDKDSSSGKISL